jgi:hypothetical protein
MCPKCLSENTKGGGKDGRIIFLNEIGLEDVDCIELAQNRIMWWALVNTVRTFGLNKRRGIFAISFSRRPMSHDAVRHSR